MDQRTLGDGLTVSAIGLGCMGMSAFYGTTDEPEALATIDRALELGCTLLDTAEMYGPHTNEQLRRQGARRAAATRYASRRSSASAGRRPSDNPTRRLIDGSPENVRRSIEGSLQRLGTDHVDLYYQHRIDPGTPIEETVGALAELVSEGKVRHIGLSEAAPETIRRAHAVHPIAAVQTEYSLWSRDVEAEILPTLRELGIGLVAYSPLGRGFLTGRFSSTDELDEDDFRRHQPRFTGENIEAEPPARRRSSARSRAEHECTTGQLALAWVLAQGEDIVPIPGTKRRAYLEENLGAADVELTSDDLARHRRRAAARRPASATTRAA